MADGSHVRVVARIRPLSKTEIERNSTEAVTSLASLERSVQKEFKETDEPELLQVQVPDAPKRWFELDAVFDKNSTQEEVYIKCGAKNAVCENIFKGFNCTILAYGQVGLLFTGEVFWRRLRRSESLTSHLLSFVDGRR